MLMASLAEFGHFKPWAASMVVAHLCWQAPASLSICRIMQALHGLVQWWMR
jgi:hypothetical protein